MTHICVSKLIIIGSESGLLSGQRQAIISTNAGILLIANLGTNFSENLMEIHSFSFKKMELKMSAEQTIKQLICWLFQMPWCSCNITIYAFKLVKNVHLKVLVHMHVWCVVGVPCLHLFTIVTSSHMHGNILSDKGCVDLKLVTLTNSGILLLKTV